MEPEPPQQETTNEMADWLATARGGSAEALGRVLELYRRYLLDVANAELDTMLQAKAGASDLVQETFLEAQRIFDRFGGGAGAELRAWLRAILLNKVATFTRHYRDTAKRQTGKEVGIDVGSELQVHPEAPGDTPSMVVNRAEEAARVTAALERLPEHYRQIIVWRQLEGLAFEDMATRLNRSVDAVRKLWWRAIQQLQKELQDAPSV